MKAMNRRVARKLAPQRAPISLRMTSVIGSSLDSVVKFDEGITQLCAPVWEGTSFMKYMAAALLLVASMSAQNAPSANKGGRLDIPAISRGANGSIVSIVMSDKDGHPIAQGSGFLISKDGQVVTNYHVIRNGRSAVIKFPDGTFFAVDGVLESDKDRDVAIIQAHGNGFKALALGDSDQLKVGEEVVAIGNPLSLESTVSNGIVSAIRTLEDEGRKLVQTTAPISPGSSGGPLFNMAGKVVGITTSHMKGGENLNFAIPINDVKWMIELCNSRWGAIVFPLPDEPEPVTSSVNSTENKGLFDILHVTSYKFVDLSDVPGNCESDYHGNSLCTSGIYTVEGRITPSIYHDDKRIGVHHFVLQCKSLLVIGGKTTREIKCWSLAPGKDYAVTRVGEDILLLDGPPDPPRFGWTYTILQETE